MVNGLQSGRQVLGKAARVDGPRTQGSVWLGTQCCAASKGSSHPSPSASYVPRTVPEAGHTTPPPPCCPSSQRRLPEVQGSQPAQRRGSERCPHACPRPLTTLVMVSCEKGGPGSLSSPPAGAHLLLPWLRRAPNPVSSEPGPGAVGCSGVSLAEVKPPADPRALSPPAAVLRDTGSRGLAGPPGRRRHWSPDTLQAATCHLPTRNLALPHPRRTLTIQWDLVGAAGTSAPGETPQPTKVSCRRTQPRGLCGHLLFRHFQGAKPSHIPR